MVHRFGLHALVLGAVAAAGPAWADPYICVGALSDVEVLFHVRKDAYFRHNPLAGRNLRVEYAGCGYRVYVERSPRARDADLLLVDRFGHVTRVVHGAGGRSRR
jgi:hypothetical protein